MLIEGILFAAVVWLWLSRRAGYLDLAETIADLNERLTDVERRSDMLPQPQADELPHATPSMAQALLAELARREKQEGAA